MSKEEFQRFARTPRAALPPQPAGLAARGVDSILFRTLDADHDGRISAEELAGATAALKKLDRNGDGALSVPELAGPRSPGAVQRIQQGELVRRLEGLFRERDKNQDGKISKEEAPEAWQRYFDRLDRNSDGVLDKAEAAQVVRRFIGNRPSDRPQDGARPRRPADTDKPAAKDKPRDTDKPAAKDRPRDKDKPADKD